HPSLREDVAQRASGGLVALSRAGRRRIDDLVEEEVALVERVVRSRELDGTTPVLLEERRRVLLADHASRPAHRHTPWFNRRISGLAGMPSRRPRRPFPSIRRTCPGTPRCCRVPDDGVPAVRLKRQT